MSIIEVTYYEVACDEPDCGQRTSTDDSEFSAWNEPRLAEDQWDCGEGQVVGDGTHYCPQHWRTDDAEAAS